MAVDPIESRGVGHARRAQPAAPPGHVRAGAAAPGFGRVLAERIAAGDERGQVRWSAHARDRLAERGISVTPEVAARLEGAVGAAAAKGGRDSLVLVDDLAFVVSVANRTVITAVESDALRSRVFTNIDSAVLG